MREALNQERRLLLDDYLSKKHRNCRKYLCKEILNRYFMVDEAFEEAFFGSGVSDYTF